MALTACAVYEPSSRSNLLLISRVYFFGADPAAALRKAQMSDFLKKKNPTYMQLRRQMQRRKQNIYYVLPAVENASAAWSEQDGTGPPTVFVTQHTCFVEERETKIK